MTPLDYYLWGAVKYKCHADKPETIDALKVNIREAIGEIRVNKENCRISGTENPQAYTEKPMHPKRRL